MARSLNKEDSKHAEMDKTPNHYNRDPGSDNKSIAKGTKIDDVTNAEGVIIDFMQKMIHQILQSIVDYQHVINQSRKYRTQLIKDREPNNETVYQLYPIVNEFIKFLFTHVESLMKDPTNISVQNKYGLYLNKSNKTEIEKAFICLGLFKMLD